MSKVMSFIRAIGRKIKAMMTWLRPKVNWVMDILYGIWISFFTKGG
jgi:hypothetical protein